MMRRVECGEECFKNIAKSLQNGKKLESELVLVYTDSVIKFLVVLCVEARS